MELHYTFPEGNPKENKVALIDDIAQNARPDDLEQSLSTLASLGLEGLQASTYLCLLQQGLLSASQIAQRIKVNRTDVYRILRALSARGLVNTIIQSPNLFEATKPELAVKALVAELEEHVKRARRHTPDLIITLNSLRNTGESASTNEGEDGRIRSGSARFKLITGRQVIAAWKNLLKSAQREVIRVWSPEGVRSNYNQGFIDDFSECTSRGIKIRAITEINKSNLFECEEFASILELRHLDALSDVVRYEIADDSEVIISSMNYKNDEPRLEGILTNNKVLINGFRKDFESLWRRAIPAKSRLEDLRKRIPRKPN